MTASDSTAIHGYLCAALPDQTVKPYFNGLLLDELNAANLIPRLGWDFHNINCGRGTKAGKNILDSSNGS